MEKRDFIIEFGNPFLRMEMSMRILLRENVSSIEVKRSHWKSRETGS
jgi:hypothetical protein